MYQTILVPIDLGHLEKGKPMIRLAQQLVNQDGRIVLVNVVEEMPAYIAAQLPEGLIKNAHQHATEELKAIANSAGIKADIKIGSGSAHNAILEIANDQGVNLIIVGSHKPEFQDYLLGSTAARIVRHAKCAVLVER